MEVGEEAAVAVQTGQNVILQEVLLPGRQRARIGPDRGHGHGRGMRRRRGRGLHCGRRGCRLNVDGLRGLARPPAFGIGSSNGEEDDRDVVEELFEQYLGREGGGGRRRRRQEDEDLRRGRSRPRRNRTENEDIEVSSSKEEEISDNDMLSPMPSNAEHSNDTLVSPLFLYSY